MWHKVMPFIKIIHTFVLTSKLIAQMNDSDKIRYLKILKAYDEIIVVIGGLASYISKEYIITKTLEKLIKEGVSTSRRSIYRALSSRKDMEKERYMNNA